MKAILEFDFESENFDRNEFEDAINGYKWKAAMNDLDQELRARTKYAPDDSNQDVVDAFYKLRDEIREILNSYDLSLD